MAATAPGSYLRTRLLGSVASTVVTGVTTGISKPVDVKAFSNLVFYLTADAALSQGTLILEEADWSPDRESSYGGAWSTMATITLSTPFASAAGQYAYHVGGPGGAYNYSFVRCRIGTTVVGGLLSVVLLAN